jgi:hypothetical protein
VKEVVHQYTFRWQKKQGGRMRERAPALFAAAGMIVDGEENQ